MKIKLVVAGKTEDTYIAEGIDKYIQRIKRYLPFEMATIPALKTTKNMAEGEKKQKEGELLLKQIDQQDILVLLDEKGKELTSRGFSGFITHKMNSSVKNLVFAVGGPYGFSDAVYKRANEKISLSKMTFSHQMVRLFFAEQLYRALTIMRNEPYHHD